MKRLMSKVDRFRDDIVEYETFFEEDADVLVLAYGSVARSSLRAVNDARVRGFKAGFFRPITLWPFPDKELESWQERLKPSWFPSSTGKMVLEVERAVRGRAKVVPLNLVNGELFKPEEILAVIEEVA